MAGDQEACTQREKEELSASRDDPHSTILAGLLLLSLAVVVYLPALRCGFIWDDDNYLWGNHPLLAPDGLVEIWLRPGATPQYYPLVHTSFWFEYRLWGFRPLGFHLVNMLLHAGNACLLWLALRRLGLRWAWFIAAVFAVHPVHVESVAWVTERKNVLSGFLYLIALINLLRFFRLEPRTSGGEEARPSWAAYCMGVACFILALLSKTVTCSLPAAILLLIWWRRGRVNRREVLALAPMFLVGAALGLFTVWVEKHFVGASGPDWALSPIERCLIAGRALWFYLAKVVWPSQLSFIYPRWRVDDGVWWQYVYPATALGAMIALWLARRRLGRGPLVSVLFFAGTLFPALGFFDVLPFRFSFVADHFQYLASIGMIVLCTQCVRALAERSPRARAPWAVISALLLALLGALTWRQIHSYESPETLWRDTIEKNPSAIIAYNNLGTHFARLKRYSEASDVLRAGLAVDPDHPDLLCNLGGVLLSQGEYLEAEPLLRRALAVDPDSPWTLHNLGWALLETDRPEEAVEYLRRAVSIPPSMVQAHTRLGIALHRTGHVAEAAAVLEQALSIDPSYGPARRALAEFRPPR